MNFNITLPFSDPFYNFKLLQISKSCFFFFQKNNLIDLNLHIYKTISKIPLLSSGLSP